MENKNNEIQKSDIFYAFEGAQEFVKKGSVIKEQITNVVLPKLNSTLSDYSEKASNILEDCGEMPNKEVGKWWTVDHKIVCPYRIYDWCELYYNGDGLHSDFESLSVEDVKKCNKPKSQAEAENRKKYNEYVDTICNVLTDIKACEILMRSIVVDKDYTLNLRQLVALDF